MCCRNGWGGPDQNGCVADQSVTGYHSCVPATGSRMLSGRGSLFNNLFNNVFGRVLAFDDSPATEALNTSAALNTPTALIEPASSRRNLATTVVCVADEMDKAAAEKAA